MSGFSYEERMMNDIKTRNKNGMRISLSQAKWLVEQFEQQQEQIKVYEMQLKGALFNTNHEPISKRTIELED
jgi:hypothetical protein